MSTASTRARGNALAQAMAMQPEPVPTSSTRRTRAGSIQGAKRRSMSSAIGERGMSTRASTVMRTPANQLTPVRYAAGMRSRMRRVSSRRARSLRRASDAAAVERGAAGGRQAEGMQHQRRGLVARIVGAVPEENARAREARGAPSDECTAR